MGKDVKKLGHSETISFELEKFPTKSTEFDFPLFFACGGEWKLKLGFPFTFGIYLYPQNDSCLGEYKFTFELFSFSEETQKPKPVIQNQAKKVFDKKFINQKLGWGWKHFWENVFVTNAKYRLDVTIEKIDGRQTILSSPQRKNIFNVSKLCDVKITNFEDSEKKPIYCSKYVLSSQSSYFETMFQSGFKESIPQRDKDLDNNFFHVIEIKDTSYEYLHTEQIEIGSDYKKQKEFFRLAAIFDLQNLIDYLVEIFVPDTDNCFDIIALCNLYPLLSTKQLPTK
eukprot:Awhi_evm1s1919